MKYFVVSDVHGYYTKMREALAAKGYDKDNPEHVIISLGDIFDRGDEPYEMLMFFNSIPRDRKILVRGNHEDCLDDALVRHDFKAHDHHNGTDATVKLLYQHEHPEEAGQIVPTFDMCEWLLKWEPYKQYVSEMQDYAIVGKYIFVHGWLPDVFWCRNLKGDIEYLEKMDWTDWRDARWTNGMRAWHNGFRVDGYTVVCGHWHTSWGNSRYHHSGVEFINPNYDYAADNVVPYENFNPFIDEGIIAIDACTAYSGQVNVFTFED